jgi:glucose/mannose transport system substrate-binding protein
MKKRLVQALISTGISIVLSACSSSNGSHGGEGGSGGGGSSDAATKTVEIYSWWISSGEAEALQALVELHQNNYPRDRIVNEAKDSGEATRAELAQKIDAGDPPDLFQGNAYGLASFLDAHPGSLESMDDFMADQGLDEAILPDILKDVTVDGKVYAMPVNISRENALFYNKQIFDKYKLSPPTTIPEFLDICEQLKAADVTPIATGYQGWIIRLMFNSLAMGSMGTEAFNAYMAGGTRDNVQFGEAIDLLDKVLTYYVDDEMRDESFGWTDAADAVHDGKAAMYFHGDWAKAYFEQLGWDPGTDFGVVGAPGAAEMFWYGVDTFSMPKGGPNPDGAWRFLSTVGSKEGQVAFNNLKGSSPTRLDVPETALDSEAQKTLIDLKDAKFRTLMVGKDAWDNALLAFAKNRDKSALMQVYADNPPQAQ